MQAAGATATVSRDAPAALSNPANLIMSRGLEPYFELGLVSATYTYTPLLETLPVATTKVAATPVVVGMTLKPRARRFALGAVFVPLGTGKMATVRDVPLQISGSSFEVVNVDTSAGGYQFGVGGALTVVPGLTLGAGVIRIQETNTLTLYKFDPTSPIVDAYYLGASNQYVLGLRGSALTNGRLVIGGALKLPVTKTYKGEIYTPLTRGQYQPIGTVGYAPMVFTTGVEIRQRSLGLFGEYRREFTSKGRKIKASGLSSEDVEADLIDTNSFVIGGHLRFLGSHRLMGAFGLYPANTGDGLIAKTADGSPGIVVTGVQFGDLASVPRYVYAGGYSIKAGRFGADGYFNYISGYRQVPEGAPGDGTYSLSVILFGFSIVYQF